MTWFVGFALAVVGAGTATSWLFRLVDKLEEKEQKEERILDTMLIKQLLETLVDKLEGRR